MGTKRDLPNLVRRTARNARTQVHIVAVKCERFRRGASRSRQVDRRAWRRSSRASPMARGAGWLHKQCARSPRRCRRTAAVVGNDKAAARWAELRCGDRWRSATWRSGARCRGDLPTWRVWRWWQRSPSEVPARSSRRTPLPAEETRRSDAAGQPGSRSSVPSPRRRARYVSRASCSVLIAHLGSSATAWRHRAGRRSRALRRSR